MEDIKKYSNNSLIIELSEDEKKILFKWIGKSVDRDPGVFLNPIFSELLVESKKKNKELIMDFTTFSYMNSSTIMTISKFLEKGRNGNHKISINYDESKRWQKLSFSALRIFQEVNGNIVFRGK